jgi:hypothetical protein
MKVVRISTCIFGLLLVDFASCRLLKENERISTSLRKDVVSFGISE